MHLGIDAYHGGVPHGEQQSDSEIKEAKDMCIPYSMCPHCDLNDRVRTKAILYNTEAVGG